MFVDAAVLSFTILLLFSILFRTFSNVCSAFFFAFASITFVINVFTIFSINVFFLTYFPKLFFSVSFSTSFLLFDGCVALLLLGDAL